MISQTPCLYSVAFVDVPEYNPEKETGVMFMKARQSLLIYLFIATCGWAVESLSLTPELEIQPIEPRIFLVVHRFPGACNSLLVRCADETFVWLDTPLTHQATQCVHQWLVQTYDNPQVIQINTGFHNDNLAGNGYLIEQGIPCYGSEETVRLLMDCWPNTVQQVLPYYETAGVKYKEAVLQTMVPPDRLYCLSDGLMLEVGGESIEVYYPGPSHTRDNVVVYFHTRHLLYGGCMIKAATARTPGFTGDADMEAWAPSVQRVFERYPHARTVVPGHGHWGDLNLLHHTIAICEGTR